MCRLAVHSLTQFRCAVLLRKFSLLLIRVPYPLLIKKNYVTFINIASHEIKTPTQAILGFSEITNQHPEKRDEMIEAIQRNAARLPRLTNDVLDVSRIESHTLKLNKERFNLRELISNIAKDYASQSSNASVQLIYKSEKKDDDNNTPFYVEADKARLTQIISNLISNAIKFTEKRLFLLYQKRNTIKSFLTQRIQVWVYMQKYCRGCLQNLQPNPKWEQGSDCLSLKV
jgi:signal transduction histidine kinase